MAQKKKQYKLPSKMLIGGMEFKIILKEIEDFGIMDFDARVICIRKSLTKEEQLDTLMHEVHHAALGVSGLSNILNDDNLEEALVRLVEHMVVPIIKEEHKKFIKKR
jgi:Zn-dependent peptidase ImmA (M78 family)